MTETTTISWIFLATAIASKTAPADYNSISGFADGINHAVPSEDEIKSSLEWLTDKGLVLEQESKYNLTERGKVEFQNAFHPASNIFEVWDNLIAAIELYKK